MNDKVLIALIAFGGAVIGSVFSTFFAPWVKFKIQERLQKLDDVRQAKQRRRELITTWRAMVNEIARKARPADSPDSPAAIQREIQHHVDFASLEPHLSEEGRRWAYGPVRMITLGVEIPQPLYHLQQEIARIEREWGVA